MFESRAKDGGDGGSRTRVRKSAATGFYMLSPQYIVGNVIPAGSAHIPYPGRVDPRRAGNALLHPCTKSTLIGTPYRVEAPSTGSLIKLPVRSCYLHLNLGTSRFIPQSGMAYATSLPEKLGMLTITSSIPSKPNSSPFQLLIRKKYGIISTITSESL